MQNLTPNAEPVSWATVIALAVAAAASYGLGITDALEEFLVVAVPVIAGALWARFKVYAPDTHDQEIEAILDERDEAVAAAREAGPTGARG